MLRYRVLSRCFLPKWCRDVGTQEPAILYKLSKISNLNCVKDIHQFLTVHCISSDEKQRYIKSWKASNRVNRQTIHTCGRTHTKHRAFLSFPRYSGTSKCFAIEITRTVQGNPYNVHTTSGTTIDLSHSYPKFGSTQQPKPWTPSYPENAQFNCKWFY